MAGNYDSDTQKFISDVMPTRDPDPRPTQTQSPDVQPGNTAATYPEGWREHAGFAAKQIIGATSKIRAGGSPTAVITKAVLKTGLKDALRQQEKQASVPTPLETYKLLNEALGKGAWFDWEPETIVRSFEIYEKVVPNMDTVQALQVILKTNQAHESWHVFENVGQALNGNHVDFDIVQPLRPDEVAFTVRVIDSLRKETYDQEVLAYMAACAKHSGMVFMPVDFFPVGCQAFLDGMGNDDGLKSSVERKYTSHEGSENMQEQIQLSGLKEIEDYVRVRI